MVEAIRSILKLAESMKDDLSQFVLGTMGEAQLAESVADEAQTRERALVLDLWKQSVIREDIASWLADLSPFYAPIVVPPSRKWALRLVQALGVTEPVACPLPTKPLGPENNLPPHSRIVPHPELSAGHRYRRSSAHAGPRLCITAPGFHVPYMDTAVGVYK